MMKIRKLKLREIKDIYDRHMHQDFPPMELRPFSSMRNLYRKGLYTAYGYFKDDKLIAYSCFYTSRDGEYFLLDLFAVLPHLRSHGIGSHFIRELNKMLPAACGTFIEAESPRTAKTEEETLLRRRRIDFYTKNGAVKTGAGCLLFRVDYDILFLPKDRNAVNAEDDLFEDIQDIYREMYGPFVGGLCKPYRP